eukprot:Platyproteum_vivax@DN6554_c0_g1_i1.p1
MSSSKENKKVVVLGGDGFCGWPVSLHLSNNGYDITIVDNLSRRAIDKELKTESLTPICSIADRIAAWKQVSGKEIKFENINVATEYDKLVDLFATLKPRATVHFAEQRAAPYSMKNSKNKRYTVNNNITGTNNVLCAIGDSGVDIHLVHLGTMGVYGYGGTNSEIPEGYVDVTFPDGEQRNILHPAYPGSLYHTTKCLDALLFQFFGKNDKLRITDLHQGIVWGTNTEETKSDPRLVNRFDYDSDYGTVLNRFLMQSALGLDITVYGTGGQTRAIIHIQDTCRCVKLAIEHPPAPNSPPMIINQVAETITIGYLAEQIAMDTNCKISYLNNPRQEASKNDLHVSNKTFRLMGWDPILLADQLIHEVQETAAKFRDRCDTSIIMPCSFWNAERAAQCASQPILDMRTAEVVKAQKQGNPTHTNNSHMTNGVQAKTVTNGVEKENLPVFQRVPK